MSLTHLLTPFVRYALIALSSYLVTAGLNPEVTAPLTSNDTIQTVTGLVVGGLTIVWYMLSNSRASLASRR